jgi:hypothetical protein
MRVSIKIYYKHKIPPIKWFVTNGLETIHRYEILSFKNTRFKILIIIYFTQTKLL